MVTSNLDSFKLRLLDTLKFMQAFFAKHDLRYVACGGTVLGAVRHKGFIPWDDDIDVYMPRADYQKLQTLTAELDKEGYEFLSHENTGVGYYMPFGKLSDKNSTIWEFERWPLVFGVYIDIFPLDEFDLSDEEITRMQYHSHDIFDKYMEAVSRFSLKSFFTQLRHFNVHNIGVHILSVLLRPFSQQLLDKYLRMERKWIGHRGDKCVCVPQWEGRIFRTEWFEDTIEVPFEDTKLVIPRDYDSYLKLLYGDYMQVPPVEARVSHPHFFVNLDRRYSISDIKRLMAGNS